MTWYNLNRNRGWFSCFTILGLYFPDSRREIGLWWQEEATSDEPDDPDALLPLLSIEASTSDETSPTIPLSVDYGFDLYGKDLFLVDNPLVHLIIRVKLQPVLVEGTFDDAALSGLRMEPYGSPKDYIKKFDKEMPRRSDPEGKTPIRFVCCPTKPIISMNYISVPDSGPKEVSGWASFEDPEYQTMESLLVEDDQAWILAMEVIGRDGYGGGSHVLYLKHVQGRMYRRIGMGVMYGSDMIERFSRSEYHEIELC